MSLAKELESWVGVESKLIEGKDEVCKPMIRHWCEVMEDTNQLYSDEAYAKTTKYGGVIAQPMQVQVYTMNPLWPEVEQPKSMEGVLELLEEKGFTSIVATDQGQEYFAPMKLGDQISYKLSVDEISSEKQTGRGPGYFVTFLYTFVNQQNELVCKQTFKIFVYKAS